MIIVGKLGKIRGRNRDSIRIDEFYSKRIQLQKSFTSSTMTPLHHYLPLPPKSLQTPPPQYHLPTLITTYSHQPDRKIVHDDSSMAYYSPAPLGADLNYGFERRIERDESIDEHLDGLCESLQRAAERGDGERKGGIITWRGMITR